MKLLPLQDCESHGANNILTLPWASRESKLHNVVNREYMELVRREVSFARNLPLNVVIAVVGWIYFVAWTISFYPQVLCMHTKFVH